MPYSIVHVNGHSGDQIIKEDEETHHLGILRSVTASTVSKTNENLDRQKLVLRTECSGYSFRIPPPGNDASSFTLQSASPSCCLCLNYGYYLRQNYLCWKEPMHRKMLRQSKSSPQDALQLPLTACLAHFQSACALLAVS